MKNLSRQPFQLAVEPLHNATYALALFQRPFPASRDGHDLPYVHVGRISGLALVSAQDLVLEVLRKHHYKPAVLQHGKKKRLDLSEESGVRLSVLFKAIAFLSNLDHIRALQHAIWAMSDEETYYWFAKCSGPNECRGVRALCTLYNPLLLDGSHDHNGSNLAYQEKIEAEKKQEETMKLTKARQHSITQLQGAIEAVERLVPQEQKRSSRQRRKWLELAHEVFRVHCPKLDLAVPELGTFYRPEQFLQNARKVAEQLQQQELSGSGAQDAPSCDEPRGEGGQPDSSGAITRQERGERS
jgi:hypothetical protein